MTFKGDGFSGSCIHSVFEQKQFFIKVVVDGVWSLAMKLRVLHTTV